MAREHNARQGDQLAYVLHTYPYRETSLIVEVFSRDFGRLPLMARGARRPKSAVRGLLLSFQPLSLSWFGKAELRTLHSAEWQGGQPLLQGTALICGFYLNELLLKLLHRDDPHEQLFLYYQETLQELARRTD
ncbi:MAG: DNA repair protein RecO, partial [Sulfuricella sp.]